jgi:hypothetical protein
MGLFKTQIHYSVVHQIVNVCYAHSDIPALASRLATIITKMCGMTHFRHSAMNRQSGDFRLPLTVALIDVSRPKLTINEHF